jgi:NitT/TauT family transport system permease protein
MPLVGHPTPGVREALSQRPALWADAIVIALAGAILGALIAIGQRFAAPHHEVVEIDLSLWSLPTYTFLSMTRGFAAYLLSLLFTLIYGTIAAHNQRAERVMIPALDVLQAIPVLGFLPGLVLAMISLFPTREVGLELACIVMIFTGQVWNMTFSFHASLRGIPLVLREAATVQGWTGWQQFRLLELPSAMIGLIWNSMMSMAGGWFFLTVAEAFTLSNRDYRLPGVGSYMNEAIHQGDGAAMLAGVVAMMLMIVAVDQIVWRPLVVWSQRFKVEETAQTDLPRSWVLEAVRRSRIQRAILRWHSRIREMALSKQRRTKVVSWPEWLLPILRWVFMVSLGAFALWGIIALVRLLSHVPLRDASTNEDWLTLLLALFASFLRTTAAVAIGAAWTLPVGIAIGLSPKWSQRLQPVIQVVASFPAPMLFPLVAILLHALSIPFTLGCVILMLLGSQWYILFNVLAGAMAIPADLKEVAQVYHWSHWKRWTSLYLPSVFPFLVTGLITAAGGAWNATIVSEYVVLKGETLTAFGLGSTISHATAEGNYGLLAASVLLMAAFVVLLNRIFWKRIYRVAESRYSLNV